MERLAWQWQDIIIDVNSCQCIFCDNWDIMLKLPLIMNQLEGNNTEKVKNFTMELDIFITIAN